MNRTGSPLMLSFALTMLVTGPLFTSSRVLADESDQRPNILLHVADDLLCLPTKEAR